MPATPASITAVIPAHDAAATLATALAGVAELGEVVVVDDGSSDDTGAVARAHGARVIRHEAPRGPAAARNAGIAAVDAELVVLLDTDADPDPGWLRPLLAHLADPAVAGAAPRVRARPGGGLLGRYEAAAGPLDLGPAGGTVDPLGPVPFVSTTALVLRRAAWAAVGGFAEDLRYGEDLDLAWRLVSRGQQLRYEPASTVWHPHRSRLRDHMANRYRYGTAGGPLARRHGLPRPAVAPPLVSVAFTAGVLGRWRTAAALGAAALALEATTPGRGAGPAGGARPSSATAARGLAAAVSRPWLPVAVAAAVAVPRARAPVAGLVLARSLTLRRRTGAEVPVAQWLVLRALDDAAFSLGVIRGCLAARTALPLLPAAPGARPRPVEAP